MNQTGLVINRQINRKTAQFIFRDLLAFGNMCEVINFLLITQCCQACVARFQEVTYPSNYFLACQE